MMSTAAWQLKYALCLGKPSQNIRAKIQVGLVVMSVKDVESNEAVDF